MQPILRAQRQTKKEDIAQVKTAKTTTAEKESKENLIVSIKHPDKKKTETAVADIKLSDKKDTETAITDIKLFKKKDIKTAAADRKITEEKASATGTKSSMKINPVVALNIGKKDSSQSVLTLSDSIGKRQKFAFNKKQNNKQQGLKTADATQRKDFIPSGPGSKNPPARYSRILKFHLLLPARIFLPLKMPKNGTPAFYNIYLPKMTLHLHLLPENILRMTHWLPLKHLLNL